MGLYRHREVNKITDMPGIEGRSVPLSSMTAELFFIVAGLSTLNKF